MIYNDSQKKAVMHTTGPMMVLAGPGSGKTAVITGRTCQLVTSGISASRILVVTFTRAAAKEMKERYLKAMGKTSTQVTFGTFHGVFYAILRHTYRMSGNNILSEEEKKRLMRELVNHYARDLEEEDLEENLAREISTVKNNQIPLEHYYSACMPQEKFREIYEAYEKWRKENKKLDFDDLMVQCKRLFLERPEVLRAWQQKFQYILIDEFQDISPAQYEIVRMLALPENNLFIVGDDDQSIYQFRGAKPEIMLNFPKDYPGAAQVVLDKNYRSTEFIVKRSQCLIHHNKKRYEKAIFTDNEKGAPVAIRGYKNPREEMRAVAEELQEAAKSQKSIEGWFAHIEEYQQKMKEKQKQRAESAEGVMVSTLHSVKGLEYDKVYLLDVNEGVMPYQKAVLAEAIEEERRMFYVGMTRARKELTLCYVEERFEKKVEPSRFLDEVIQ